MSLTMHSISVPVFVRSLEALSAALDKAAAWCTARKVDPAVLCGTRLIPDMFALSRQVQIACDFAKNTTARLGGVEAPKFADDEKTIEELQARIAKTIAYVTAADAAPIDAAGGREIVFPVGPRTAKMGGEDYLVHFALPNFHFHLSMAYAILRQSGVDIGKADFMGKVPGFQPT
jgi:hypothetical protein